MHPVYLDPSGSQIGKKESIADTARVLGRMFDGIEYRGFGQEIVEDLAKYAGVPVWNGLTNEFHPTQILADFLTIQEHFGELKGKKLVYMGDARYNMGNSLMVGCAKMGMHFVACAPEAYFPDKALVATSASRSPPRPARRSSSTPTSPVRRSGRARHLYRRLGVDGRAGRRSGSSASTTFSPIRSTPSAMALAGAQCRVHALPARVPRPQHRPSARRSARSIGLEAMEVTDEVFESPQSIVFDEAENRMHTIKAVMAATLCKEL